MGSVYRSTTDRMFAGVCGGLATALGLPSWLVRAVFVFGGGIFIWIYLILASVLPSE
ncbi:PspC domain-containing protein [Lactiplantibacillus daowaiensis]|uniref:PspC domain-containing protein n=1 Tax=Lactiplantibacillus daowaiensis TaxID=2559918 RepID=A0ABW1S029_9LACO|nr:PspC domain-containing protein [Lactiplantibacillus daowaiensis]